MNCQADDAVLEVFTAGGSYVFIAGAQHVVQPKGQELTFTKCLCCLLFLCEFLKGTEGGGPFSLYMDSQTFSDNINKFLSLRPKTLAE